jgi:hypothetical protein
MAEKVILKQGPVIEHGIPVPPSRHQGITAILRMLGVGDSVVFQKSGNNFSSFAKNAGIKVVVRTRPEGVRVWRIE